MRNERVAVNSGLADLFGLRGMEQFDIAPVAIVDDQRASPFPPFTRFNITSQSGVVAAKYPGIAIAPLQGIVVIDHVRSMANVNQNLAWGFFRPTSVVADYPLPLLSSSVLMTGRSDVDAPQLGAVPFSATPAGTQWGASILQYQQNSQQAGVDCNLVCPAGCVLVIHGDSAGTSINFSIDGRLYDAA